MEDGVTWYRCQACAAREPRALIVDLKLRTEETHRGYKHWTVGALMERDGTFLLLQKRQWPFLWDVPAGHMEVNEDPMDAVRREVEEETGLQIINPDLVFHEEIFPDACRRGAVIHEWHVYRGQATGSLQPSDDEARELRWVRPSEMLSLPFVRPAYVIFDAMHLWNDPLFVKEKSVDS